MRLWKQPPQQILRLVSHEQFSFLTARDAEAYLAILGVLYRHRHEQQLEVPFDVLLEDSRAIFAQFMPGRDWNAADLNVHLTALEEWKSVIMRLEPRRIVKIQDRGLDRYLVRLTEDAASLLGYLEARASQREKDRSASLARFHLRDVEDALQSVLQVADLESPTDAALCRAGRDFARAQMGVEEAAKELLNLDVWLSEKALETPDPNCIREMISRLESYLERFLEDVIQRRQNSMDRIERLASLPFEPFRLGVHRAQLLEASEDPLLNASGVVPPTPEETIYQLREFLEEGGMLDRCCMAVHARLADVVGHLRRHLESLVRRSELRAQLQRAAHILLVAPESEANRLAVDGLFVKLWQSAHEVMDEREGTPQSRMEPPKPRIARSAKKTRVAGARLRHRSQREVGGRALLVRQMKDLNEFVERAILQGRRSAFVSEAEVKDFNDIRMLLRTIRASFWTKSKIHRQYLSFRVDRTGSEGYVALRPAEFPGCLRLPQMIFTRENRHG